MKSTELTVIIPCYDMNESVLRAAQSALQQGDFLRVIVVDDCSPTAIALPETLLDSPRISVVRHEINQGAAAARNTGLAHAKTPWIAFLDADDTLLPNTLADRLERARHHHEANRSDTRPTVFTCGWREKNSQARTLFDRFPNGADTLAQFCSGCWWNPGSTFLCHRSVFEGRDLSFNTSFKRLEDFDWGIRFGAAGGRLISEDIVGAQVQPGMRASPEVLKDAVATIRQHVSRYSFLEQEHRARIEAYLELESATACLRSGRYAAGALHLAKSYAVLPRFRRHLSPGWTYQKVSNGEDN